MFLLPFYIAGKHSIVQASFGDRPRQREVRPAPHTAFTTRAAAAAPAATHCLLLLPPPHATESLDCACRYAQLVEAMKSAPDLHHKVRSPLQRQLPHTATHNQAAAAARSFAPTDARSGHERDAAGAVHGVADRHVYVPPLAANGRPQVRREHDASPHSKAFNALVPEHVCAQPACASFCLRVACRSPRRVSATVVCLTPAFSTRRLKSNPAYPMLFTGAPPPTLLTPIAPLSFYCSCAGSQVGLSCSEASLPSIPA
jgi:hypothetical protein